MNTFRKKRANQKSRRKQKNKMAAISEVCSICQESLDLNFKNKTNLCSGLYCDHFFHASCLSGWCKTSACTCPICRRELFPNSPTVAPDFLTPSREDLPTPVMN